MKIITLGTVLVRNKDKLDQNLSLEVGVEEQGKECTPPFPNNSYIFCSRLIFQTVNKLDDFYVCLRL